jgi:periplasmic protein TonB
LIAHSLIPQSSAISPLTGLAAIILTVVLHLAFFLNYPTPSSPPKKTTSTAIEIGLKTLSKPPAPIATPLPATPPVITPKPTAKKPAVKTPITKKPSPRKPPITKKPKPIIQPKAIIAPTPIAKPKITEPVKTEESPVEESLAKTSINAEQVDTQQTEKATSSASQSSTSPALTSRTDTAKASYETTLVAWLQRYKRYPTIAKRRGQEDIIELEFTIDKEGNVLSHKILKASTYKSLNKAAIKMITRASPLPPVPTDIQNNKTRFTFIVPVAFRLN